MALQWKVAWVTVKRAVDELVDEGWLESRHGVGTFVRVRRSASQVMLTAPRLYSHVSFLSVENFEAFHACHPNVRITLSSEPVTDIAVTDSYGLVSDRFRGQQLVSLDSLNKQFRRESWTLTDQMRRFGSYDGQLYGLPMQVGLILLQLNPSLIESVGVTSTERHLGWEQYQDILQRCRKDRDGDGVEECYGAFSRLSLYEWLVPFWQKGGRLDDREAFFGGQAFAALDDLWRMHHASRTLPIDMPPHGGETASRVIQQRFFEQRTAMRWIASPWIFERTPFPFRVALPRFGEVARQQAHAIVMAIHRGSRHPDIALEFLDFCYQRFIVGNAEYPFALAEGHRQTLRQMPPVHRLLTEALASATEPLHEGVPQRTWLIEKDILNWFRLLQDRKTMLAKLEGHWNRWPSDSASPEEDESSLVMPGDESPLHSVPQLMEAN